MGDHLRTRPEGNVDDDQQGAEALDPDEIGDDPSGDLEYPPERSVGVTDPTQDDRVTDSYADRTRREEAGWLAGGDPEQIGRLLAVGDLLDDGESDAVADASEDDDPDDLSAEEAAMHTTAPPGFDADDGYVTDDPT
jgi:hypothetical protein